MGTVEERASYPSSFSPHCEVSSGPHHMIASGILWGGGRWDFGLPNPIQVAARSNAFKDNVVVAGAHDFNTWNQMFTIFARDYLWKPEVFVKIRLDLIKTDIGTTRLNRGNTTALTVKLDQAYKLLAKGTNAEVVDVLNGFVVQVNSLHSEGKLTAEEATRLVDAAERIIFNVGYWL
jgi:hypothetical protein